MARGMVQRVQLVVIQFHQRGMVQYSVLHD
jgi:hypothetical protein